jgi:hypothetical protein
MERHPEIVDVVVHLEPVERRQAEPDQRLSPPQSSHGQSPRSVRKL